MNDLQEKAIRMALEALVNFGQGNSEPAKALRQALAQSEQEPVVWDVLNGICHHSSHSTETKAKDVAAEMQKRHNLSGSLAAFNVKPRAVTKEIK